MKPRRKLILVCAAVLVVTGVAIAAFVLHARAQATELLLADPDALSPAIASSARAAGATIFADDCAACHGANGKGAAPLGVPDLTDHDWLYGAGRVSEIAQTVRYGIRSGDPRARNLADMPAYAHAVPYAREKLPPLAPNDVQDLVAFLLRQEHRPTNADAAGRGEKIFKTRGGCWDCHGEDGHGDNAVGAPNLTDRIWLYGDGSPAGIFRSIADGHQGVCPAWVNRLSAAEILDVAVYVQSREEAQQ
jgi:cytochrome c oxidase cbb3-type subunit 3